MNRSRTWPQRLGIAATALWIIGAGLYFYAHFTLVFYRANKRAVDTALSSLRAWLP